MEGAKRIMLLLCGCVNMEWFGGRDGADKKSKVNEYVIYNVTVCFCNVCVVGICAISEYRCILHIIWS